MAPEEQNAARGVVDDERGSIGGRPDDVVLEPLTVREGSTSTSVRRTHGLS